ncbi:MAG: putative porin [Bacteroidales bacterium]|jgi:hypothetical protein|nr:putative porin [Bacteroidales bacterium]
MRRLKISLLFLLFIAGICQVIAQSRVVHDIDSVMDMSPDYLPTHFTHLNLIEFEPLKYEQIDTGLIVTHYFDPLLRPEIIYQDLSIFGQAHQNMIFEYDKEMGFEYQTLPYPLFFKKQSDLYFYKLKTTYTKVAYTMSFPIKNNNEIFAEFANYSKGVTIVMNLYGTSNERKHINNHKTRNLCGNLLIHYEFPSSKYGIRASYIINNLTNTENGGLYDYLNERSLSAFSKITTHDFALQNYVNLKDKKNRYFGTFTHHFQVNQTTLRYVDNSLVLYPHYEAYFSEQETNDSTRVLSVKNSLQWSNFSPFQEESKKKNYFHIAGGVLYDHSELRYSFNPFNSLYLFTRTHLRLFNVMDITGQFSYSIVSDYFNNDLFAKAGISWEINKEKEYSVSVNACYYRNDPDYIMKCVSINNFRWVNSFQKQNIVQLQVFWNYEQYSVSASNYYLNNLVYLSEELRPIQDNNNGNLIQFSTLIPFKYQNFGTTANLNLQYCTNKVVSVPLFAGKLSVFYTFEFLKKRLKILVGTDVMYNTSYYADGYLPILREFYYQKTQLTGNYIYWNANITFRIDRINFFFRAGNILTAAFTNRNFTTTGYPNQYLFSIGISWRFHD